MKLLAALEKTAKGGDVAAATSQVNAVVAEHQAARAWLQASEWSQ